VSVAGFYDKALFVGYINVEPAGICKVLACMTSDGVIQFYTRGGLRLPRTDNGRIQLVAPWTYLAEDIERPQLAKVQTLCQFFFAVAGVSDGVVTTKKSWFRSLQVSCRLVGEGMGTLSVSVPVIGGENALEDVGYEGGDEAGDAPGIQVKKSARILQRLVGMARRVNEHWAQHVEKELTSAWPSLKKHWRK
jgi:hypothetical protein